MSGRQCCCVALLRVVTGALRLGEDALVLTKRGDTYSLAFLSRSLHADKSVLLTPAATWVWLLIRCSMTLVVSPLIALITFGCVVLYCCVIS